MSLLDPFEAPAVPLQGTYAVVYRDGRCLLLGGPRCTLAVEQADRRLLLTDGDRTYKPRPRGEGRTELLWSQVVMIRPMACRIGSQLRGVARGHARDGTT